MMKGKKSVIIAVVILVAISVIGIAVGFNMKKNTDVPQNQTEQSEKETSVTENKEQKKTDSNNSEMPDKRPAFIYFVSEDDEKYGEAIKVFEELKAKYSDKVDFELKNVTQDPTILENFALVDGNTPALIMDGREGITGFQFKMTDKSTLEKEIEKAL